MPRYHEAIRSRQSTGERLFGIRRLLGHGLHWDEGLPTTLDSSYASRLTEADRTASIVPPGTREGPFTLLYVHDFEALSEIRNATVHAFLVWVLRPAEGGYNLFWAIHTLNTGRWTGVYLAVIGPFRRWLVYPSLLKNLRTTWIREIARG